MNFKSKEAFRKWNAYGHMRTKTNLMVKAKPGRTSMFAATPGHQKVFIKGKPMKIRHTR